MKYFLKEDMRSEAEASRKNAIGKARSDVNQIFEKAGICPCMLDLDEAARSKANLFGKVLWHFRAIREIRKSCAPLRQGDSFYIQYPLLHHSIFIGSCLRDLVRRRVQMFFLVHDLDTLRIVRASRSPLEKIRIWLEETQALQKCTKIIVHNDVMRSKLAEMGVSPEKIISLGLFDYLLPTGMKFDQSRFQKNGGIVIAGNLDKVKSAYLGDLPVDVSWNLYGVGYKDDGRDHVTYKGSFPPEELVSHLEGSFGLVWDGVSAETCAGAYGEYLRLNNPHKFSLYLAAGLPVIIWKEAALATFVTENRLGFTVSSLREICDKLLSLSDEEYQTMKENAKQIGMRLRSGQYLLTALSKVEENNQ